MSYRPTCIKQTAERLFSVFPPFLPPQKWKFPPSSVNQTLSHYSIADPRPALFNAAYTTTHLNTPPQPFILPSSAADCASIACDAHTLLCGSAEKHSSGCVSVLYSLSVFVSVFMLLHKTTCLHLCCACREKNHNLKLSSLFSFPLMAKKWFNLKSKSK